MALRSGIGFIEVPKHGHLRADDPTVLWEASNFSRVRNQVGGLITIAPAHICSPAPPQLVPLSLQALPAVGLILCELQRQLSRFSISRMQLIQFGPKVVPVVA
jgi:hypothetical protein